MKGASRTRLVALVVVLAISVALVAVALSSGGDDPEPAGLRVERTPGVAEIVVYVEDLDANRRDTADGAARITLECVDSDARVVWSSREFWPFTETDDGTFDPHVHLRMPPARVERIERCRLKDTDPPLEGRLI
jgi:hypothetical protein